MSGTSSGSRALDRAGLLGNQKSLRRQFKPIGSYGRAPPAKRERWSTLAGYGQLGAPDTTIRAISANSQPPYTRPTHEPSIGDQNLHTRAK
jgi:hypothetical protein